MSQYHSRLFHRAFRCSIIAVLGFMQTLNPAFATIETLPSQESAWLSQDTDSLFTLVGQFSVGAVSDIEVQGNILYFNSGPFWVVADVSDPAQPVELTRLKFNQGTRFIVEDQVAYISDRNNLYLFDVSDPADPRQLGAAVLRGVPEDLVIQDEFLYIATFVGVFVIDVGDPAEPREIGSLPSYMFSHLDFDSPICTEIAIRDTLAYVGTNEGLHLVDISNSAELAEISFIPVNPVTGIFDVDLVGDLVYLGGDKFHVLDLADPYTPRLLTTLELGTRSHEVTIRDGYVYIADNENGLRVLDMSDPAHPTPFASLNLPYHGFAIALGDEQAYVAALESGVRMVDLSNPAQPAEVGAIETFDTLRGVFIEDDIAYIAASRAGLLILDVSDLTHPRKIASYHLGDDAQSDVVVEGEVAYVVGRVLHLIDVSAPATPKRLGAIDVGDPGGGILRSMSIVEEIAYISGEGGLHLYDVADPSNPKALGSLTFCEHWASCALDIVVENEIAYLVDFYNVVRLVDVSDPTQPAIVGRIDLPDYVRDVAAKGHLVFITAGSFLHIIDTTDPDAPVDLAALDLGASTDRLTVSESHAYVSTGGGINLIDVAIPSAPHLIGRYPIADGVGDMVIASEFVYMSTSTSFLILRHQDFVSTRDPAPSFEQIDHIEVVSGYPNPFSSQVTLQYQLSQAGQVRVVLYDLLGRSIRVLSDLWQPTGLHHVTWDGLDQQGNKVPSGVYFYRITMNASSRSGQLVLLP